MQSPTLELEIVDDIDNFRCLREEWSALLEMSRQETIFLTWEWLITWWETFSVDSARLQIVLLRDDGKLVAVAPFFVSSRGFRRRRVLQFIGIGEPDHDQVVSEYLDVFSLVEYEQQVVSLLVEWLARPNDWHRFECRDVKQGFLIWQIVQKLKPRYFWEIHKDRTAFSVPLDPGTSYMDRLSKSRRKRLSRSLRALDAAGGLEHRSITTSAEIHDSFKRLAQLHSERWRTKNRHGVFESEKFSRFHLRLLELLWPLGKAGIETYSIAGEPHAVLYCFYTNQVAYYYQSGFASADANRYMPLSHAHNREIERHTEMGRQYYDLMRGGTDSYKRDFGCETFPLYRLYLFRTRLEYKVFMLRIIVGSQVSALLARFGIQRY